MTIHTHIHLPSSSVVLLLSTLCLLSTEHTKVSLPCVLPILHTIRHPSKNKIKSIDFSEEFTLFYSCIYCLNTSIQNSWVVKFLFLSTSCLSAQASFLDCSKLAIHISWRELWLGFEEENQKASGLGQFRWLTWALHLWGSHPWQCREIKAVGYSRTLADREERFFAIRTFLKHVSDIHPSTTGPSHAPVDGWEETLPEVPIKRAIKLTRARFSDQVWLQTSS